MSSTALRRSPKRRQSPRIHSTPGAWRDANPSSSADSSQQRRHKRKQVIDLERFSQTTVRNAAAIERVQQILMGRDEDRRRQRRPLPGEEVRELVSSHAGQLHVEHQATRRRQRRAIEKMLGGGKYLCADALEAEGSGKTRSHRLVVVDDRHPSLCFLQHVWGIGKLIVSGAHFLTGDDSVASGSNQYDRRPPGVW